MTATITAQLHATTSTATTTATTTTAATTSIAIKMPKNPIKSQTKLSWLGKSHTLQRSSKNKTPSTTNESQISGARQNVAANLATQMRAVSSPSLSDAMQQESAAMTAAMQLRSNAVSSSASGDSTPTTAATSSSSSTEPHLPTSQSVGVLQKFKRTLTSFNKGAQQQPPQDQGAATGPSVSTMQPSTVNSQTDAAATPNVSITITASSSASQLDTGTGKYRFGPLIWRSSKERRKTKYNRRDKCNSGDSGIQIELENDDQFARILGGPTAGSSGIATTAPVTTAATGQLGDKMSVPPKQRIVRRANSAKATSIMEHQKSSMSALSAKAKILKRMELQGFEEREAPESLPTRSLSQPNGLDMFGIGRAELDESDSDSVASHDEAPNYYPIYAEVLYSFTAAGPQELGLERNTLIEVLRKEVGPWWFGRIRKEENTLVEEILDPELGWFPKEFVRVIQCPETDAFFLAQMSQASSARARANHGANANAAPTPPPPAHASGCSSPTDADNTIIDENNVTTIVIESPSYSSLTNTPQGANGECTAPAPSHSISPLPSSTDTLRLSAVKELLDTEVNYVKLLYSICEGYLPAMSKRIDIFSPNSIRLIFSNITAIYKFQRKFLDALRKGIEQKQVAKVFLKMHKGFLCYSTYCNAYPRALIELESYDRVKDAKIILDNCRESENLAELPLSAHLLAPVQRICRYPLHLAEIIKNAVKSTQPVPYDLAQFEQLDVSQLDIPDTRETIDMALEAMRSITEAVNEGKRHSETIARHQASFQNFKGPPLHLHSTRFFLQIDATRQKQNLWNSSCTLFLFDNQLIYCKRDIIKRSHFIYKGRIFLDRCRVVNIRDGKMFGHTIKNSLRMYCEARDKWFDFSFRSANRKHRFLSTLALERQFGGKAFYVSEMTGFEYAFEERDYSDQSDYEMPECENGLVAAVRHWSMADVTVNGTSATSGESSVPESPVKYKYSDTLPKKSQTREAPGSGTSGECQTSSLGRRRLGNWFRKPKSSNSTPNHSPTHKPGGELSNEMNTMVGGSENNISLAAIDVSSGSSG